jgi:hypothetical protein
VTTNTEGLSYASSGTVESDHGLSSDFGRLEVEGWLVDRQALHPKAVLLHVLWDSTDLISRVDDNCIGFGAIAEFIVDFNVSSIDVVETLDRFNSLAFLRKAESVVNLFVSGLDLFIQSSGVCLGVFDGLDGFSEVLSPMYGLPPVQCWIWSHATMSCSG